MLLGVLAVCFCSVYAMVAVVFVDRARIHGVEPPLSGCIGFRLGATHRRVDRLFNRAYKPLGLDYPQAQILLCLLDEGLLHAHDLAGRTGYDPSTVSRLVRELVRRKLVSRKPDPDDGRKRLLAPAKRARKLQPRMAQIQERVNDRLLRTLVRRDVDGFLNLAEVLERLP